MMKANTPPVVLAVVAFVLATSPAAAHVGSGAQVSIMKGLGHPLMGLDHVLAMAAIGLWAASGAGRTLWPIGLATIGAMAIGITMPSIGLSVPLVEPVILVSVLTVGLLVAASIRVSPVSGMVIAAAFALFHGFAHGSEIGQARDIYVVTGVLFSSAVLLGLGFAIGRALSIAGGAGSRLVRLAGTGTTVTGLAMAVAQL